MLFDQGKLEKMTIRAYKPAASAEETAQVSDTPEDSYVVQVNPGSYSLNQTIDYTSQKAQGASGSNSVYTRSPARSVTFTLVFDGTGVVPAPPSALSGVPLAGAIASALSDDEEFIVMDQIAKFNHVVYDYSGQIHGPRKVLLLWGGLSFSCALTSLSYDFKVFKPDGTPLRATANCTFRESISEVEREHAEANSSPDLTHIRETHEGDRLPLMAHDVYGDVKHYLAVARHNRLINFRSLRAGTRIELPRLDTPGARR